MQPETNCPTCGRPLVVTPTGRAVDETGRPVDQAGRPVGEAGRPVGEAARVVGHVARALAGNWWLLALRGGLAIIFGILTLVQPIAALTAVVLVFGVWAFIDGINALAVSITGWRSWPLLLGGLVGIAVGLFTFFRPGITAVGLYAAVAAWAIARGILEIGVAIELRREIEGELWLALAGVASIAFGVLMILLPVAGVLAIAWIIGVYALLFGGLMLALALRVRALAHGKPTGASLGGATPQPV